MSTGVSRTAPDSASSRLPAAFPRAPASFIRRYTMILLRSLPQARLGIPLCTLLLSVQALALTRDVTIESNPPGAAITVNSQPVGMTPLPKLKLEFKSGQQVVLQAALDGYETQTLTLSYEQGKAIKGSPYRLPAFELPRIRLTLPAEIGSTVAEAKVTLNGASVGSAPASTNLLFSRANGSAPWSSNVVSAAKPPQYAADTRTITFEEALAAGPGPLRIQLSPGEVQREVPVDIRANEKDAKVTVAGQEVGVTPMRHTLVFKRSSASDPWQPIPVRIEKEGFEYAPIGTPTPEPAFVFNVPADYRSNVVETLHLRPQALVPSPIYYYHDLGRQIRIVSTNHLSAVAGPLEKDLFTVSTYSSEKPLVLSRISPVPGEPGSVVCSLPVWDERTGAETMAVSNRVVGANIYKITATGPSPLTSGKYFDLDPFVHGDYVYFSSLRADNQRIIWRKRLDGRGGYAPVTGTHTHWDREPAVSPDGSLLAYVARNPEAPGGGTPQIWMAQPDGIRPQQRWEGHSPTWSPDNLNVAFVTPDGRLAFAEVERNLVTYLTDGDTVVLGPCWLNTETILYSTDKGVNERNERNFDLWERNIHAERPVQKNTNGSYDAWPAVGSEGREIFFLSNRGAVRPFQERLIIYRIDLASASTPAPLTR